MQNVFLIPFLIPFLLSLAPEIGAYLFSASTTRKVQDRWLLSLSGLIYLSANHLAWGLQEYTQCPWKNQMSHWKRHGTKRLLFTRNFQECECESASFRGQLSAEWLLRITNQAASALRRSGARTGGVSRNQGILWFLQGGNCEQMERHIFIFF